jgi:hypothetical protein
MKQEEKYAFWLAWAIVIGLFIWCLNLSERNQNLFDENSQLTDQVEYLESERLEAEK